MEGVIDSLVKEEIEKRKEMVKKGIKTKEIIKNDIEQIRKDCRNIKEKIRNYTRKDKLDKRTKFVLLMLNHSKFIMNLGGKFIRLQFEVI